jgi:hypothetical protein
MLAFLKLANMTDRENTEVVINGGVITTSNKDVRFEYTPVYGISHIGEDVNEEQRMAIIDAASEFEHKVLSILGKLPTEQMFIDKASKLLGMTVFKSENFKSEKHSHWWYSYQWVNKKTGEWYGDSHGAGWGDKGVDGYAIKDECELFQYRRSSGWFVEYHWLGSENDPHVVDDNGKPLW